MAKRRSRSYTAAPIVRTVAQAPIVRVQVPRQTIARSSGKRRRHHRRSSGGGSLNQKTMFGAVVGGAALGFVDKLLGSSIPTIPILGRAGTIALGAYFLAKGRGGIMRDIAISGASIAGYQFGTTGKVSGEIPDQVHGIAAQV